MNAKQVTKTDTKKAYHQELLVAHVRRGGAVSRKQLGHSTRIRMPVITALVRELIKSGVLIESGRGESERGRKQVLLSLNRRHGFVVGVEFDADRMLTVVVDVCGDVVTELDAAMPSRKTPDAIMAAVVAAVESAIRKSGYPPSALKGIGVADPGVVDSGEGIALFCSMLPEWVDVPVRRLLESRFSVPVWLDANTRTKTLCEHCHGAGRGARNLLYVDIGCGIGCGIVLDGRLYRGHTGMAGELGHARVLENGPICNCGSSGCLETVASYPAILRQVRKALQEGAQSMIPVLAGHGQDSIAMTHVVQAARQGDKLALGLMDRAVHYLGYAIANAANLLNPEAVVISSSQAAAEDVIVAPIQQIVDRHAIRLSGKSLEIRAARIGKEAGAWGAAMLMLDRLFDGGAGAITVSDRPE